MSGVCWWKQLGRTASPQERQLTPKKERKLQLKRYKKYPGMRKNVCANGTRNSTPMAKSKCKPVPPLLGNWLALFGQSGKKCPSSNQQTLNKGIQMQEWTKSRAVMMGRTLGQTMRHLAC